jgi:hypothetical protein
MAVAEGRWREVVRAAAGIGWLHWSGGLGTATVRDPWLMLHVPPTLQKPWSWPSAAANPSSSNGMAMLSPRSSPSASLNSGFGRARLISVPLIDERLGIAHSVPDDECAFARVNPRSLDIDAAVLADWLAGQASDRFWTVDGEPRIQEMLPLPCSGSDLAAVLKNRGSRVRVFGPDATREASAADLAGWATQDEDGLVFELAWLSGGKPGD